MSGYVPNATASFARDTTYASSTVPYFIPTEVLPFDVSQNATFPASVTVGKDLTVDESANVGIDLVVGGNISAGGNIETVTGYINQGDVTEGTNYINVDGLGNPNIQIDAKEGGDGQAYFDLITQKLTTSTNLHRVRSIVGNTGAYTVFHQTGAPGPLTILQNMNWSADGTEMQFAFGGTPALTMAKPAVGPSFAAVPGLVSVYGQNTNIAVNATTTIFTLSASQFGSFAAQVPVTLNFFPGDLATAYAVTYILNVGKLAGNLGFYVENQAIADAALPAGWTLSASGSGTPTITISVTTDPTPLGAGGQFCNYTATFIGAGEV
jgi:hypothetical protein